MKTFYSIFFALIIICVGCSNNHTILSTNKLAHILYDTHIYDEMIRNQSLTQNWDSTTLKKQYALAMEKVYKKYNTNKKQVASSYEDHKNDLVKWEELVLTLKNISEEHSP